MTTYTANNQRIQFFINYSAKYTANEIKKAKYERLNQLKEDLLQQNVFINELFPAKQFLVLEQIIYWINKNNGICKFGTDKLIQSIQDNINVSVSVRTVRNAIKTIKLTNQFIITRLQSNRCNNGKYVIVDMKHENFKEILKEVFLLSDDKIAQQFAHQKTKKSIDEALVQQQSIDKSKSSNLNIFLKQAISNNNISIVDQSDKEAIREEIEEQQPKSIDEQRKLLLTYISSEYQCLFFDWLVSMPYSSKITHNAYKLALRMGSVADLKVFIAAKDVIHHIAMDMNSGTRFENVVAAFSSALKKRLNYPYIRPVTIVKSDNKVNPIAFYNWIDK